MRKLLGVDEAEELFQSLNEKPKISIRVNTLKASVDEVVEELRMEGKTPEISSRVPTVIKFDGPYDFDNSRLYREGKIVVQDVRSNLIGFVVSTWSCPGTKER